MRRHSTLLNQWHEGQLTGVRVLFWISIIQVKAQFLNKEKPHVKQKCQKGLELFVITDASSTLIFYMRHSRRWEKKQQNSGCVPGTSERSLPHRWVHSSVWPGIRCNKHTNTAQTHVIWQNEVISYRQTLFRRKTQKCLVSCTLLSYLLNLPARPTEEFEFSLVMSFFS